MPLCIIFRVYPTTAKTAGSNPADLSSQSVNTTTMKRRRAALIVGFVIVLLVALVVASSYGLLNIGTKPTGTVSPYGSDTRVSADLILTLQVTPKGDGTFTIDVYVANKLGRLNNVTTESQWRLQPGDFDAFDSCGMSYSFPFGFAIFQGYYDLRNYTQARPLALYNTTYASTCTTTLYPVAYYLFGPYSDTAEAFDSRGTSLGSWNLAQSLLTSGYWTGGPGYWFGGISSAPATFHAYRGTYTVVAADEWGDVALTHFTVSN